MTLGSQQHDDYADVIAAQVPYADLHLTDLERGPLPRRARTCSGLLQAGTKGMSGFQGLRAPACIAYDFRNTTTRV